MKEVIVVTGANGSGKTTFAKDFIQEKSYYFVNADEIGATLKEQEGFQLKAGRIFFETINQIVDEGRNFVMESTLSGNYLGRTIRQLRKHEYAIRIVYVFLENPETCIERVRIRVRKGGHNVPEEDIRRRYYQSKNNFWTKYRQLADNWLLLYNSDDSFQEAALGNSEKFVIVNETLFEKFIKDISDGSKKIDDLSLYQFASEVVRIGNRAVKKAKEENKKLGLPNVFTRNGKIYYELPDGEITTESPL